MATNSYSYGSLGERWTVGDPTSKDRLDTSRVKADANRWTLTQLLDDPDDSPFALADGTTATTQSPGNATAKVATTAFVTTAVGGGFSSGDAHTWTADQTFNDDVKVTLGTGGDVDLYYDGTNTVLNTKVEGNGNLLIG